MSDIEVKVGADPEFFLKDKETGKFVSAHGMVEGTKDNPKVVDGGAVQVDGMALEFNINPASDLKEFKGNITTVLAQLREMVPDQYEFVFTPIADFGAEYIAEQPEEARRLGCTPDYNAWLGFVANPAPNAEMPFRTASGHIHVGWTEEQDIADPDHLEACMMMTKQLDLFLGCIGGLFDVDKLDLQRRNLYGKAGAFRPKKYGVEYRTLSNNWLRDDRYIDLVYNNTIAAFNLLMEGQRYYEKYNYSRLNNNINNCAVKEAYSMLSYYYVVPEMMVLFDEWRNANVKPVELDDLNRYAVDWNTQVYGQQPDEIRIPARRRRRPAQGIAAVQDLNEDILQDVRGRALNAG